MPATKQIVKTESLKIEKDIKFANLYSDIANSEKNNTGFIVKGFFNTNANWESLISLIHSESQKSNKRLESIIADSVLRGGMDEKVYGNVLVVEGLYHSIRYADDNEPLEYMKEVDDTVFGLRGDALLSVEGKVIKTSIGSRFVDFHKDQWGALIFQLVGTSTWFLSHPDSNYEDSFLTEPGDLLYFPREMLHAIKSHSARASVIVPVDYVGS